MRSDRAVVAVAVFGVAGCAITDVERPIGLIADGLTAIDAANLEQAALCWNLQVGTQFVVGAEAASVEQQVEVFYDDTTCLHAIAQVQGGWPTQIGICPPRYWSGLGAVYSVATRVSPLTAFRVLSHELGHVLNIVGHPDPDEYLAVMKQGGSSFGPMFNPIDLAMFADANPGFAVSTECGRVVRSLLPGTGGQVSHCACDNGPFDVSRPIVIVPAAEISRELVPRLAAAAGCWNLRYGTTVVLRPPEPGDQIAYLEPLQAAECAHSRAVRAPGDLLRAQDGNQATLCALGNLSSPLNEVGRVLGISSYYMEGGDPPLFLPDDEFAMLYPGREIACRNLQYEGLTGECSCLDDGAVAPRQQPIRSGTTALP